MKRFFAVISVLPLFFISLVLTGCAEKTSWHQKMIVTVDTPDGERSASSVVHLQAARGTLEIPGITSRASIGRQARGEAVALDLGKGQFLFALLKGETSSGGARVNAGYAFSDAGLNKILEPELIDALPLGSKGELIGRARPLLVTFDDITKPETVRRVDPDNLAATFGQGYGLKSITLEITNEPITQGRVENFIFFKRLKSQSTLSGLEKFDPEKSDAVNYLTNKAFKLGR